MTADPHLPTPSRPAPSGHGWVAYGNPAHPHLGFLAISVITPVPRDPGHSLNDTLAQRRRPRPTPDHTTPAIAVTLLPSSPQPTRVIGVGANYPKPNDPTPPPSSYPVLFTKYASTLTGAYDDIVLPDETVHADYEGELAIIIGTPGRRIPTAQAHNHILGYSVANDVTLRDWQSRSHQWLQGKAWDRTTPLGPVITPADDVDLHTARIHTAVNGTTVQHGYIRDMTRPVDELIESPRVCWRLG
ncbi:fumarylacetoacetate hydrolase family protein [Gordonia McavH-238-E]|uniref:fumarylacetoacetate hydrolase family protein n=1 Tax=Gordonia sp. McavH-238-E TaxID=2917736 RepID=UPI001EF45ABE|nr:fumarylacetoacetate hydrolase family protein [Gordonia sp. McavH-238-E]MCG7635266.1 fumarylacetoacetate hydrolase family protein [Gordonia sp. McavH-238-E]